MIQFFETVMGRRFFEGQLPALIKALGRIADALEVKTVEQKCDLIREHFRKGDELEKQKCLREVMSLLSDLEKTE